MEGKLKVFAGSSHPELARDICEHLDTPLGRSEVVRFANENLMVKIQENVRECDVFVVQTSAPPVSDGIIELLITIDALRSASARRITAVIPYFPYCRSDKKDRPRISIAARLMADLLQTAGADRVLTMDLHSPQIQGFFRVPCDNLEAATIICEYFLANRNLDNHVLVAADAGEAKELGRFANRLRLPIAIIDKRRYADDDRAYAQNLVGDVKGKHALIVDDEIATGGTLIEAASFLEKEGALSVSAAATHPVLCGPALDRIAASNLREVVITDSIPMDPRCAPELRSRFTILPVAHVFAKAIRRIHEGDSVSALFR
jgi:ribose-phosphate pyrophosphokinase